MCRSRPPVRQHLAAGSHGTTRIAPHFAHGGEGESAGTLQEAVRLVPAVRIVRKRAPERECFLTKRAWQWPRQRRSVGFPPQTGRFGRTNAFRLPVAASATSPCPVPAIRRGAEWADASTSLAGSPSPGSRLPTAPGPSRRFSLLPGADSTSAAFPSAPATTPLNGTATTRSTAISRCAASQSSGTVAICCRTSRPPRPSALTCASLPPPGARRRG